MLMRSLPALLVAASTANALRDAHPFVLLSTESIKSDALRSAEISTSTSLQNDISAILSKCDASLYVFVEHPGVHAADLRDGNVMPQMARRVNGEQYKSVVQIPEVLGEMDLVRLEDEASRCKASSVKMVRLSAIWDKEGSSGRREMLKEADAMIDEPAILANHTSHVLIYTGVSANQFVEEENEDRYEMDEPPFQENLHTDIKRGLGKRQQSGGKGDDFQNGLPLFEKYQFLSPGIFMGLTVSLLLLIILYVGISAIAGLEVSYMAFSKEMGPQAQKKQQ